jgi:hypothetical protein
VNWRPTDQPLKQAPAKRAGFGKAAAGSEATTAASLPSGAALKRTARALTRVFEFVAAVRRSRRLLIFRLPFERAPRYTTNFLWGGLLRRFHRWPQMEQMRTITKRGLEPSSSRKSLRSAPGSRARIGLCDKLVTRRAGFFLRFWRAPCAQYMRTYSETRRLRAHGRPTSRGSDDRPSKF